jgi:hypothetical protein
MHMSAFGGEADIFGQKADVRSRSYGVILISYQLAVSLVRYFTTLTVTFGQTGHSKVRLS